MKNNASKSIDTIVVPAQEKGFKEQFMERNQWYAIRIGPSMINKIKYIAAYRVTPVSAITHYAEVEKIEKYRGTKKYILYFKAQAKEVKPIQIGPDKNKAPQSPRYTSLSRLLSAKTVADIYNVD